MEKFTPAKKPLVNDKIIISIRLEELRLNEIDKLANSLDISRNELINQCIEYAFNNLEFKKKEEKQEND